MFNVTLAKNIVYPIYCCVCQPECIWTSAINTKTFSGKSRLCWLLGARMLRNQLTSSQTHVDFVHFYFVFFVVKTVKDLWVQVLFSFVLSFHLIVLLTGSLLGTFCSNRWMHFSRRPEFIGRDVFSVYTPFWDWFVRTCIPAPRKKR